MTSRTEALGNRTIEAIGYDRDRAELSVRFNDGMVAAVMLSALKLPDKQVETVAIDEFRRGIEFLFADGSMHDVAADYITWLTDAEYAARYPATDELGPVVGANVRRLRKRLGLSQEALAEALGMNQPNLSRMEAGKHVPTLDVLIRIAVELGTSISALLEVNATTGTISSRAPA